MSLIEAMTMAAGLVYLVLLAWQARTGWQWRLALGLLLMLWLLVADSLLWLGLGLVVVPLALWHRYRPLPVLGGINSQSLRAQDGPRASARTVASSSPRARKNSAQAASTLAGSAA